MKWVLERENGVSEGWADGDSKRREVGFYAQQNNAAMAIDHDHDSQEDLLPYCNSIIAFFFFFLPQSN